MQSWFKKCFKVFLVLIVVWFLSIITLLKYPLPGFGDSLPSTLKMETTVMDSKDKFKATLHKITDKNFDEKMINKSESKFRGKFLIEITFIHFFL